MACEVIDLGGAQLIVGETLLSNCLVVRAGGRALLVDAMGGAADAAWLAAWLRGQRLAVETVVATHYLSDHMAALRLFPGVAIVAHPAAAATFAAEAHRTAEEAGFFVAPTRALGAPERITFGGLALDVFPNPGYTRCMLNIDVPGLDLAHAGDTIVGAMVFVAYADLARLRGAIARLAGLGRRRVVGSHGRVMGPGALAAAAEYLENLAAAVAAGRRPALRECLAAGAASAGVDEYYHQRNLEALSENPTLAWID